MTPDKVQVGETMTFRQAVEVLKEGKNAQCRPYGNSMVPYINSGDLVVLTPETNDLKVGDIVACKVKGNFLLHLISAIQGERYQISNAKGYINGWITKKAIYGKRI